MIHIHTTRKKEVLTRQSFEAFTSLLKVDPRFYLCNRGIVINLEHAVDFDGKEFLLDDETRIPVSRGSSSKMPRRLLWIIFSKGGHSHEPVSVPISGTHRDPSGNVPRLSSGKQLSAAETSETDSLAFSPASGGSVFRAVFCPVSFKFQRYPFFLLLPLLLFLYHKTLRISIWKSGSIFLAVCAVFACLNSLSGR